MGWTLYDNQVPDDETLYLSGIAEINRHPIWNQQFLIPNPTAVVRQEGFLYICIKDKFSSEIQTIYLPINPMKPFIPYNFEFIVSKKEYDARAKVYMSFNLEMANPESFQDGLVDVALNMVHLDPMPYASRMFIMMTLNNHRPDNNPFIPCDLSSPINIFKIIQENSLEKQRTFISPILKIPPGVQDFLYESVATFTLPKTLLEEDVTFFLAGRDENTGVFHAMPNSIVGHTDIADETLKKLYYQKKKIPAYVPITWSKDSNIFPVFSVCKGTIELNVFGEEDTKQEILKKQSTLQENKNKVNSEENNIENLGGNDFSNIKDNKQKWEVLSRELAQKQEIIHRMIKEIDDKTESLKITGAEIVDLRRQIKMLQSENAILRKRLAHEEQIEISSLVSKEIAQMTSDELKQKIIKIAQAYRDERIRNEEFEKALKSAQKDISQSRQLSIELEALQRQHQDGSKKLLRMQQEIQKTALYKETINKQEKVIAKLEKLLEHSLKDTQRARNSIIELEQVKSENLNLQKQLKALAFGPDGQNSELEKYKYECVNLERIVSELREELKSKRPITSYGGDEKEKEKIELEVKLQKAQARVEALQEELTINTKNFAKEIANLKMIIAEKQAQLDTLIAGEI